MRQSKQPPQKKCYNNSYSNNFMIIMRKQLFAVCLPPVKNDILSLCT